MIDIIVDTTSMLGKKYNIRNRTIKESGSNCLGFIRSIDPYFNKVLSETLKKNSSRNNDENGNLKNIYSKHYDIVNFEKRTEGDIILIKGRDSKHWSHIGKLIDRFHLIHNHHVTYGSNIDPISYFQHLNKDFLILREV